MLLLNHIKISIRNLVRHKIYALINIVGLSVGLSSVILIGIYTKFETSYDKFFKDSDRIYRVALHRIYPGRTKDFGTSAINIATVLKDNYPQVEHATRLHRLFFENEVPILIDETQKTFIETKFLFADSLFFDVFSHKFIHGNPSTALDNAESIVITRNTALKYFGTEDVLNKTVQSRGEPLQITGVIENIPDNSHIHFDVLGSISALDFLQNSIREDNWISPWVYTYVKLKAGISPEKLESHFDDMVHTYGDASISRGVGADWLESDHQFNYYLQALPDIHLYSQLDVEVEPNSNISYIYILGSIAMIILIISTINFINLSIARSTERAKEVGIKKALGSYKSDLIQQFLAESVFMCFLASILAVGTLYFFLPSFNQLLGTHLDFSLLFDPLVMIAIIGFIFLVGIFSGLYPAFSISSLSPSVVLKGSYKSSEKGVWLRNVLITFQFLISIVMISGSIIAAQQMHYLKNKYLGFNKENLLIIKQSQALDVNYSVFVNELKSIRDIEAISNANIIPGQFHGSNVFNVDDPNVPDIRVNVSSVDDNYFKSMGIDLVVGRGFDSQFSDSLSIVINEAAVKAMGVPNPIGYKFQAGSDQDDPEPIFTIIGVVQDYNFYSLHAEVGPMVIFNLDPDEVASNTVVRLKGNNISDVIKEVNSKWQLLTEEDFNYSFLEADLENQYQADQNTSSMFDIFTFIAIIMSCTGLFGLATYIVNQRSKEMSIRKVLGSNVFQTIRLFASEFMGLIGIGFFVGVPIAIIAMREWLNNFAYHIDIGIMSFFLAGLITVLLVLLTVSYHAIRIARVNPVRILRTD